MKSKLLRITQAILLALTGALAWGAIGRVSPAPTTVSAATLSVQSAGPATPLSAVGNGFTYQGHLLDGGNPANGTYDFRFTLFDALTGGNQVGTPVTITGVAVVSGLFTVTLDFGSTAFQGSARWLEIAVQHNGGGYTTLTPRQPLTPTPYALFAMKTQGYKNMVVVAKAGGDFTSIQTALDSITDASASNHYLVKIAPGVYTETVTMKQYVDIEGSGEKTTRITFTGTPTQNTGTVVGADNAELRSLTVKNTGGDNEAIAIYNNNASPSLLHVTANASGGSSNNFGVYNNTNSSPTMTNMTIIASSPSASSNIGVLNVNSSPTMDNVTATASGGTNSYGVYNISSSSPPMHSVTATAAGASTSNVGVYNVSVSPKMNNVIASASGPSGSTNYGVYNTLNASPAMTNVTATASGGLEDYGVYNNSSSPMMTNVTVSATNGVQDNIGVYNKTSSSPTMTNVTVSATGAVQENIGVKNEASSSPTMNNVTVSATGGADAIGVSNYNASVTIHNSAITASGDTSVNWGIGNSGSTSNHTVRIDNSTITGSTNSIVTGFGFTTRVGASKLSGGPIGGTVTCAGVYDENYNFYANTCP